MFEQVIKWQKDRNLDKMPYYHGDECKNIIEEVCETFGFNRLYADEIMKKIYDDEIQHFCTKDDKVDAYFDICVYAIGAMMKLGYDPIKVFEEGLKEINERTGAYDAQVGKWVKQPKKQNAYKADYSRARL